MKPTHLLYLLAIVLLSACGSGPDNDLIEEEIEAHYLELSDVGGIYYTIDDIDVNSKTQDATNEDRWTIEAEIEGSQEVMITEEASEPTEFTHTLRFEFINKNSDWEVREIPESLWK